MLNFRAIAPREVLPAAGEDTVIERSWNHHSDARWEAMKSRIVQLYIEENKSADQVVAALEEDPENSFVTSRRQLFVQLEKWDIGKKKKRPSNADIEKGVLTPESTIQPGSSSSPPSVTQPPCAVDGASVPQLFDVPGTSLGSPIAFLQPASHDLNHEASQSGPPKSADVANPDDEDTKSTSQQDLDIFIDAFDREFQLAKDDVELDKFARKPDETPQPLAEPPQAVILGPRDFYLPSPLLLYPRPAWLSLPEPPWITPFERSCTCRSTSSYTGGQKSVHVKCRWPNSSTVLTASGSLSKEGSNATVQTPMPLDNKELFTGGAGPKLTPKTLFLLDTDLKGEMRERMERFRAKFIDEYEKFEKCLQNGKPALRKLAGQLPGYREVWGLAMATMRRLSRLKEPSNVLGALSFLLVSRVVVESAEEDRYSHMSDFEHDLVNWKTAYPLVESIAISMWGIIFVDWWCFTCRGGTPWDESVLKLRESVAALIAKAVDMFGLDGDSSSRQSDPPTTSPQDNARVVDSHLAQPLGYSRSDHPPTKRRKVDDKGLSSDDPISPNLNRRYNLVNKNTGSGHVAVTLATGIIFAMVIYFILTFINACTGAGNPFELSINPWPSMAPWSNLGEQAPAVASLVSTDGQGPTLWPTMLSRPSTPLAEWKPDTTTPTSTYTAEDFYLDGEISHSFVMCS